MHGLNDLAKNKVKTQVILSTVMNFGYQKRLDHSDLLIEYPLQKKESIGISVIHKILPRII